MSDDSYGIMLNIDGPRDPEYTLEVGEAFAEAARVLNHVSRDHGALRYPSEADRLLRYIATAAARLPQLLGQVDRWLEEEYQAGRVTVDGGPLKDRPMLAVATVSTHLEEASRLAGELQGRLDAAASVTTDLGGGAEDGDD